MDPYSPSPAGYESPLASSSALVSQAVIDQLARTKPWVRLMSVLLFVGAGFLVLAAIAMFVVGAIGAGTTGMRNAAMGAGMGVGLGAFYLVLAVLYIFPGMKLWKYASRIEHLIQSNQELDLVSALSEQRAFWKFAGIAAVLCIVLYIVGIGAVVIAAAASRV